MIGWEAKLATEDDEEKQIAEDFRRQLQERFPAYEGDRARDNVTNWVRGNSAVLQEFISTLGLSNGNALLDEMQLELENLPLPNPRDEPFTHQIIESLCHEVEAACREAGVPLRGGIAYGVAPTFELTAEQHPVPTTETSIVQLSAGFISFCSHLSKAMSMSLSHELVGSVKVTYNAEDALKRIGVEPELKRLWLELFGAYAYGDGPLNIEMRVVPYPQSLTRALLLHGFEQFAIAHEYAHHVAEHGVAESISVGGNPESADQEIEADIFAVALCRYIETRKQYPNTFLVSGVAPVVLLKCLGYVRRTRRIFAGKEDSQEASSTHPETEERVLAFDSYVDGVPPGLAAAFQQMRHDVCSIIDTVWNRLSPLYRLMYEDGLRVADSPVAWLPGSAGRRY